MRIRGRISRPAAGVLILLATACSEPGAPNPEPLPAAAGIYPLGADQLIALTARELGGAAGPDLFAAAESDGTIRILPGLGTGAFDTAVALPAESDTRGVASGDVNGDGIPDLIVIGHDNAFNVRLGLGNWRFSTPVRYPVRNHGNRVVVLDLNGDAYADLVAVHDGSGQPVYVTAYLGTASGTMQKAWELATDYFTTLGVTSGDFDGDGHPDIAIVIGDPRAAALVLRNLGPDTAPTIAALAPLPASPGVSDGSIGIAAGDLDGDGRADLVIACYGQTNKLVIRRGTATGFTDPVGLPLPSPIAVALGDVDGDGRLDVVAANPDSGTLSLLYGHGDGTFAPPISIPAGPAPAYLALGDFNQDGRTDIATINLGEQAVRVFLTADATAKAAGQ